MKILSLVIGMLVSAAGAWAQQESCPQQLQQYQYEASITDNQRAAAVRDLAKANRIIGEFRARVAQLEKDVAKAKEPEKKE